MAKVRGTRRIMQVMAPFENVSAKFALVREKAGLNNGGVKYFGARQIVSLARGGLVTNFYFRKYGRSTQPTTKELKLREIFTASVKGTKLIFTDLTQLDKVQQAFLASLKNPSVRYNGVCNDGTYSIRGWVRAVQYAGGYNAYISGGGSGSYDYNKFPNSPDA